MPPLGSEEGCGLRDGAAFVGQPESALIGVEFSGPSRIIKPGQAVTQDFAPGRINFEIDGAGTISRTFCG
jgi:hypothetical protein